MQEFDIRNFIQSPFAVFPGAQSTGKYSNTYTINENFPIASQLLSGGRVGMPIRNW